MPSPRCARPTPPVQNAATNDRLSDYETSLKYAQEMLTWYQADGQKVISQYLPEKTRVEIDNMIKEGVRIDAQGPSHQ